MIITMFIIIQIRMTIIIIIINNDTELVLAVRPGAAQALGGARVGMSGYHIDC